MLFCLCSVEASALPRDDRAAVAKARAINASDLATTLAQLEDLALTTAKEAQIWQQKQTALLASLVASHTRRREAAETRKWRPLCEIQPPRECSRWRQQKGSTYCSPSMKHARVCIRGRALVDCSSTDRAMGGPGRARAATPTQTGAWGLGGAYVYMLDVGLANALAEFFAGSSVVELGAGLGCYTGWLRDDGSVTSAVGFDGAPGVTERTGGLVHQADLTEPDLTLPVANWALCLEVAEHIPKHLEAAFLANVAKTNNRGLVLSWANQPGNGHVNNRAPAQVVERLQQLGYAEQPDVTRTLQRAATTLPWFKTTLHVFLRTSSGSVEYNGRS